MPGLCAFLTNFVQLQVDVYNGCIDLQSLGQGLAEVTESTSFEGSRPSLSILKIFSKLSDETKQLRICIIGMAS
jgi:hypothetical protein